jgi:hypothetical protein
MQHDNQLEVENAYDIDLAMHIAECWEAGKMIGGDPDAVIAALLNEVRRLRQNRDLDRRSIKSGTGV